MLSPGSKKRRRRLELRASQEIKDALARGAISARKADDLIHMSAQKQSAELARILAVRQDAQRRASIAVEVIRKHLALGRRDLQKLRQDLKTALIQSHA